MSREKHKRGGRPRGSSAKLDDARALIAQGVEPLEALMRVGYSDPNRAYKQHAALIAESAHKANPVATLKHIAQFGATADRVRACESLLALVDDQKPTHVAPIMFGVIDARWLKPEQRRAHQVFTMPTQLAAAISAYDALCTGSGTQTKRDADGFSAIDVLNDIVVRGTAKDSELRAACVALIKKHSAKVDDNDQRRYVFMLPTNGRVPTETVLESAVIVTGAADIDPCAVFYEALALARPEENSAPSGADTNNKGFV